MTNDITAGQICKGPTSTLAELALLKSRLTQQKGLTALAEFFSVVGNLQRLSIIYLLHTNKELCVCDLAEVLGISDSAISQHLRKLKDKHIVCARRQGQSVLYSLAYNTFTKILVEVLESDEIKEPFTFIHSEIA